MPDFLTYDLFKDIMQLVVMFLIGWIAWDVIASAIKVLKNAREPSVTISDEWLLTKCAFIRMLCAVLLIAIAFAITRF